MGMSLITGIDIGRHSIKAVVVKPEKQHFTIVGFHELPVSEAVFSDNYTLNYQDSVKKLKDLKKKLPWFSQRAAIAIPDNAVISKILQIDASIEQSEQEFAIHQAFSYQSPFPIEELCLDYVSSTTPSSSATRAFQVYASKKEVIESRQTVAEKAGFKPHVMDIQAHALLNIGQYAMKKHSKSWLLVNIGHLQSTMCMAGEQAFYKDIPLGIATPSGQGKQSLSDDPLAFSRQLSERLQRQLQLLPNGREQSIDGVWLTGGGAYHALIEEQLQQAMGLPCERLAPFSLCQVKPKLSTHALDGQHQYAVALGAAIGACQWESQHHAA
ncbi:type IV pilus assembly protein PilM [Vibrio agarivorans]|uniref:Type IV pilus assembly protein PilM n=1 Tax=Vibrio agarivorans TaxID=153622 RepID=A0ABT7XW86_9VIBR|nr:type IV pilus assembly protein PilM [Vibrio agarivorans]MDN2480043.1 type IV pilus assembly protein PilM [Vibrio agarivorans]